MCHRVMASLLASTWILVHSVENGNYSVSKKMDHCD